MSDDKLAAAKRKAETKAWESEQAHWAELTVLAEVAKMPRSMVAAIRGGATLLRLAGTEVENVAIVRGQVRLAIDAHQQHARRKAEA